MVRVQVKAGGVDLAPPVARVAVLPVLALAVPANLPPVPVVALEAHPVHTRLAAVVAVVVVRSDQVLLVILLRIRKVDL